MSTHSKSAWLTSGVLIVLLLCLVPISHVYADIRGMEKSTKPTASIGSAGSSGADWAGESQYTGNVSLSIPLASVGGVNLALQYNSRVNTLVKSANSTSGSGWVGLGWTLPVGSIVGTINGTADTTDDRYQFVDGSGSSELVMSSSGDYLLRQHRPWKIHRVVISGMIRGWEITTEDGTVMRYGNYDKSLTGTQCWTNSDTLPSRATRWALGVSGVIENSAPAHYNLLSVIPTQWDLSDIQDVAGNHTTIIYLQRRATLSVGGSSSSAQYTIESHPWKIQDNLGGEIELSLGTLNSDEYFADVYTYFQTVYENQFLDTVIVKQNGQVYQRINLKYQTSKDILGIGAKKRYLNQIDIYDKAGNVMTWGKFNYWGLVDSPSFTDTTKGINPGALRLITYQTGGKVEYRYKSQANPQIVTTCTVDVGDSIRPVNTDTAPNASGIAGKDFFVVSSALYANGGNYTNAYRGMDIVAVSPIQVFRFGPLGWCRDTSFPFDSSGNTFVSDNYIVGIFKGKWKVARRAGDTWATYDVDSALTAAGITLDQGSSWTKDIAGITADYFVLKYNRRVEDPFKRYLVSLAVVQLEDAGLHVDTLAGRHREVRHVVSDMSGVEIFNVTADCSPTYLIINSADVEATCSQAPILESHFKRSNGQWKNVLGPVRLSYGPWLDVAPHNATFPTTAPKHAIGKNFVVCAYPAWGAVDAYCSSTQPAGTKIRVYRITGDNISLVDSADEQWHTNPVVGDTYYGVSYPNLYIPWFKEWNGSTFGSTKTFLNSIFPSMSANPIANWKRIDNRIICMWQDSWVYTGISTRTQAGQWLSPVFKTYRYKATFGPPGGFPLESILPITPNSLMVIYDGSSWHLDPPSQGYTYRKMDSFSFSGDSIQTRQYLMTWTVDLDSNAQTAPVFAYGSSHIFQPGNNFITASVVNLPAQSLRDTVGVISRVQDSTGYVSYGTVPYDIVLDQKRSITGMGDTLVTRYLFENASFEENLSSGKYNKATVTLPGSAGKKTTFFYNDLDGTNAREFVTATNYLDLDGRAYRQKDSSATGALVREQVSQWIADPIDVPDRGVFFIKQLKDSVVTDGVPKVTTYEYANASHLQVTKITESTSDPNVQRVTAMKYPLDYSGTSANGNDMVNALHLMKNSSHILNAVIEKRVFKKAGSDTTSVLSAELTKYKDFGTGKVLPSHSLTLRDSIVTNFTVSSIVADTFSCDQRYIVGSIVNLYNAICQPAQVTGATGVVSTTLYGSNGRVPIATVANARTSQTWLGSEGSFLGFESGTTSPAQAADEDYWSLYGSNGYNLTAAEGHTGIYSQKMPGYNVAPTCASPRFGPTRDFCPPDLVGQGRRYVISCWVKTQSGCAAGSAQLMAMSKRNDDNNNNRYPDIPAASQIASTGDTNGSWVYLEVKLDLGAVRVAGGIGANELLRIRVYPMNSDASHYMLVDDIRVYPVDGAVSSTTYDPISLLPTSQSDASGVFTSTSYDGFGRPLQVKNSSGSLLKEYSYYFSRDGVGNGGVFSPTDPNYTREKTYRAGTDTTMVKKYTDGLGRGIQTAISYADSDLISATTFDSLGRPQFVYKPYRWRNSSVHTYDSNFGSHGTAYYNDSLKTDVGNVPYVETKYVSDPLNRVRYQGAPGSIFAIGAGHDKQMSYYGFLGTLQTVTQSKDENGNISRVTKDVLGNAVKSAVIITNDSLVTQFTYDILGNLTKSTPPNGDPYSSTYKYTTRNEIRQKLTPDAEPVEYLYDKAGNLRFIKDGNHRGAINSGGKTGTYSAANSNIGNDDLTTEGQVTLQITSNIMSVGTATLKFNRNGVTLASASAPPGGGSGNVTVYLPKGTYSYGISASGGSIQGSYTITTPYSCEFIYNKYDALNRKIETGELLSTTASHFTQPLADSTIYPTGSTVASQKLIYDTVSSDAPASGQRNLKGRLSQAIQFRLGVAGSNTSYSYDEFGRIEWIVQTGVDTYGKKISYLYDLAGDVIKKGFQDISNAGNNYYIWYEYDRAGRLAKVYSGKDSLSRIQDASYTLQASSRPTQALLGPGPAQSIKYDYNSRDWSTSIASASLTEKLGYNDVVLSNPTQYNGNIGWMKLKNATLDTLGFGYSYDKASRLTKGKAWTSTSGYTNAFGMDTVKYDSSGNIRVLNRNLSNGNPMDRLTYQYVANSNKLDYIADAVAANASTTDLDNQAAGNYAYDPDGSMQKDVADSVAFAVYDVNNLPVTMYLLNGTIVQYWYDHTGQRVKKVVGSATTCYALGASGETVATTDASASTNPTYYVQGLDLVGRVDKTGSAYSGNYFLKDHLGSIRTTLKGWESVITDDFSGTLSQWTTVRGSGFAISSGALGTTTFSECILVSNTGKSIGDGSFTADVKTASSSPVGMGLVFRYQSTSSFYWVSINSSSVAVKKRVGGVDQAVGAAGSGVTSGVFNRFRIDLSTSGSTLTIQVYCNGVKKDSVQDNSPIATGPVGVIGGYGAVTWDNVVTTTNVTPGTVVSYDDLDAWGMVLENRSWKSADDARQRFKFTGKERDAESKYDYLGARYYDARIGKCLSLDPHGQLYVSLSPYSYAGNNPLVRKDPSGMDTTDASNNSPTGKQGNSAEQKENASSESIKKNADPLAPAIVGIEAQNVVLEKISKFSSQTEVIGEAAEKLVKVSKVAGKALGILQVGLALRDANKERTTASYIEAGIKIGAALGGPLSGTISGILDATGTTHSVSQDLGSHLDKQANEIKITFETGFTKLMNDMGYSGYTQ